MKVTVNSPDKIKRELIIEVDPEYLEEAKENEAKKIRARVQIPGFRKGKAPLGMIKSQYKQQIEATAVEETINQQYIEAIRQEKLAPVAPADISDFDYEPGKKFSFKATIEIEPEIKIPDLSDMKVEKEVPEVTDELFDGTMESVRQRFAETEEKEDTAAEGDVVTIDLVEIDPASGVELIGKKFNDRQLKLGEGAMGVEFDSELTGLKTGETTVVRRQIDPSEIVVGPDQEQGKKTEEAYRVTVRKIETVSLPELDDELAKKMNYQSLDELNESVRENIRRQLGEQARESFRSNLEREAVRIVDPDVPEAMVDRYLDNLIETLGRMSNRPLDLNSIREENREPARKKVQWFLIREQIIKDLNIEVGDEEVDDYLKKLAEEHQADYERLRLEYRSGEKRDSLRNELTDQKVFDFLEEKAEIVTVKKQQFDRQPGM